MYNAGKVIVGLAIAMVLFLFPVLYNAVSGEEAAPPQLELGVPDGVNECVREAEFMRREHMQLLMDWRDEVVREGDRIDQSGFDKSLTGTCLGCHQQKQEFCDKCHEYSGVSTPYCWDCHNDPQYDVAGGER